MPQIRIHFNTLIIALGLSTVLGFLSNVFATLVETEPQVFAMIGLIVNLITIIVGLPLYFSSFYLIGKRIETTIDFYSHLLSLFIGNTIGRTLGHFITVAIMLTIFPFNPNAITVLTVVVISLFSPSFFVGFSGLALGYIIKKKS